LQFIAWYNLAVCSPDEVTHLLSRTLVFLSIRCPLKHSVV
jgi:hypothetical protein